MLPLEDFKDQSLWLQITPMRFRISNLHLGVDESETALPEQVAAQLGLPNSDIHHWRILRKSLDLRAKDNIFFTYSVEVELPGDFAAQSTGRVKIEPFVEPVFHMPEPGNQLLKHRPVVVGAGPAGLAAAYFLAEQGYSPLVLERGRAVRERIHDVQAFDAGGPHDPESNYLFGEGGAGTFSDGKLTCRSSGPDVQRILQLFADCKGKPSILYEHRPHLGSNRLPAVVKAMRQKIIDMGGEFRFNCRVEDIEFSDNAVRGLATSSGHIAASVVILAIGHSARDTYEMLHARGVPMVAKPFQLGVRIEQPQDQVNRVRYGHNKLEEKIGAADYSLIARGRNDLFTFCMCAGGFVIPSVSDPGHFCTNGMSRSKHDSPFANSGLVVTLGPEHFGKDHPLAAMQLQQIYEQKAFKMGGDNYLCPIQNAKDFLAHRGTRGKVESSYARGTTTGNIADIVPSTVIDALFDGLPRLDRRWRGQFLNNATLVGPESRGSSPVRLPRDEETRECVGIHGLYPVGEGAGYAGGIVSAAVDGLRTAKVVIGNYNSEV